MMNPQEFLNNLTSIRVQEPELQSNLTFQSLAAEDFSSILSFSCSIAPYQFEHLERENPSLENIV